MIVMRLCCGLGNQMFHYALGKHLAMRNDDELRFDIAWWDQQARYEDGQDWTITLFEYDITGTEATEDDVRSVLRYPRLSHWMRGNQDLIRSPKPDLFKFNLDYVPRVFPRLAAEKFNFYREVRGSPPTDSADWAYRCRFYRGILDIEGDAYLDGYWQTPRYFEDIAEDIREDFSVPDPLPGTNAEVTEEIEDEPTPVSIHVRRGDQAERGPESDEMGNTLPLTYQQQAAEYIAERVDDPVFYLFSDDTEWAERGLDLQHPIRTMTHNDESTDYLDIELMRRCDHHVIANSTFSWWGAWLNDSDDKIVTVPVPWFNYGFPPGTALDWELFPEGWTLLDYRSGTVVSR